MKLIPVREKILIPHRLQSRQDTGQRINANVLICECQNKKNDE